MHAHMEASGPSWLPLYVANGVTGIRDMGSDLDLILKMRDDVASRRLLGPRIFAAGPILDDAPGEWPYRMRVKTADEGRAAVQVLERRGVDLIKVHDHTPRDAFFAIADEARRQNLPLAGHRPMDVSLEEMIDAGQRDLEHLDNQQLGRDCAEQAALSERCRELFAMLARRGVWQTPTLVAMSELASIGTPASSVSAGHFAYAPKSMRDMWAGNQSLFATPQVVRAMKADAEVGARVTAGMAKAGVGILTGCDTMIAGFCVHDELGAMVRGGMPPLAALQTATLNPAKYFGIEQIAGTVAPGRRADLVMLDGNPLTDIKNVSRIRAVVLAGRLLDRKELDALLVEAKRAAGQP
jgi:alpha-D-ribose 1-methylphosphonate 5-triphosphate diphosphatase PhnM